MLAVDQRGEVVQRRVEPPSFRQERHGDRKWSCRYERAGTLIVFKVFDRVSYGLIIGARAPIQVADRAYSP